MAADFTRWGYPPWFAQLTAVLQLVGGVLLLWPASVVWGAALLTCVLLVPSPRTSSTIRLPQPWLPWYSLFRW